MKFKKTLLLNIALALLISTLVVSFSGHSVLRRMKLTGLDYLFRLSGATYHNPNIVIIQINDENIEKIGRWPWDRQWYAAITRALNAFGVKYIYFDILFAEPAIEEDDDVFAAAIEEAGNVYLPFVFQEGSTDVENAIYPLDKFASHARGMGSINIFPDIDGTSREIPIFFEGDGKIYPHVSLKIAMDYMDMDIEKIDPDQMVISNPSREIKIPLVDRNEIVVNWAGRWEKTFRHYSFFEILMAYNNMLAGRAIDIDLKPLRGSICLVAVTAVGLCDIKSICVQPEYPGVGIVATVISNILEKNFLVPSAFWLNCLLIYLFGVIPFLFVTGERPLRGVLSVILTAVVFFYVVLLLFKRNFWLDYSMPLFALFASYLSVSTLDFIYVSIERGRFFQLAVTDGLTGLTNIRQFKMVLKDECSAVKAEPGKRFCVVMIDVDHFKEFNDTYGHGEGDLILKGIADVLKGSVRSSDLVARYGGEEMIVLLRNSTLDNAMNVAEKLRENIEKTPLAGKERTYRITISLGVARYRKMDDEDTISKRADQALYKAKNSGRNCVKTIEE